MSSGGELLHPGRLVKTPSPRMVTGVAWRKGIWSLMWRNVPGRGTVPTQGQHQEIRGPRGGSALEQPGDVQGNG